MNKLLTFREWVESKPTMPKKPTPSSTPSKMGDKQFDHMHSAFKHAKSLFKKPKSLESVMKHAESLGDHLNKAFKL